jgi:uncharacterized protein (DUF488 family)
VHTASVNPIYTVGHSNHSIEKLIALLAVHGIVTLADVRSHPYSRFHAQFNRKRLDASLGVAKIAYLFLGRELGARPDDPACYVDGKVDYERLARTERFGLGIADLTAAAEETRVALLCTERDPLTCHRAILVGRELAARGATLRHIHPDGRLEAHEDALDRLLRELGLDAPDLFDRGERIAAAYRQRGRDLAYTRTAAK